MTTPSQAIHEIANRLTSNMSASRINLARADLRLVADRVKELEITLAEIERDAAEELAITLAFGPSQPEPVVLQFPRRVRRVPIQDDCA